MSSTKIKTRWELPTALLNFRKGQVQLYEILTKSLKNKFAIKLPTGYGKSWCAAITYAVLRDYKGVTRCLFIVPNTQQREQYISGLRKDLFTLGITFRGIEKCDTQQPWVLKKSFRNESDIFVTTIQAISANPDWYRDLMSKGKWVVIADEYHHYSEDNSWGQSIFQIPFDFVLGMSATPFRKDKNSTILGNIPFDVEVSLRDAIAEGALRPIEVVECDYQITFTASDNEDIAHTHLMSEIEDIAKEQGLTISEWELKRKVRYLSKYVNSIFLQVLDAWIQFESRYPNQNQIIVFSMTCEHAKHLCGIFNDLAISEGLPYPFAKWVGTTEIEGEQPDNKKIIDEYLNNEFPCLINVNYCGEGFNNPRCSIGVMLDLIGESPTKIQHIGRSMRINFNAPQQMAVIFASSDSPCLDLLKAVQEESSLGVEDYIKKKKDTDSNQEVTISFSRFNDEINILDVELKEITRVYPYGTLENTIQVIKQRTPELQSIPDEKVAQFVNAYLDAHFGVNKENSEELRKKIADRVNNSVSRLVHYLCNIFFSQSGGIPKSSTKDLYKKIHGYYKKITNHYQNNLTEEELRAKLEWVVELTERVKSGDIPSWLKLS